MSVILKSNITDNNTLTRINTPTIVTLYYAMHRLFVKWTFDKFCFIDCNRVDCVQGLSAIRYSY